jgi:hypothetical protein
MPFELTDDQIERMLVRRGGTGAPHSLVADVVASVVETPQDRGWLGPVMPRISPNARTLLVAAAITIALITGALLFGGGFRSVVPPLPSASAEPSASPTPSPAPSATLNPTPTPLPIGSPTAAAPVDDHEPLIVYEYGKSAIDLFTLDAFTGERVPMGQMQRGAPVAGQSIHWSADRQSAFVFQGSDSVSARIDIADRSVSSLAGIGPSPSRDAVSPAGDQIARLTDQNDIEILDLGGERVATLALPDGIQPLLRIVWSPDASMIAVSSCLPCEAKGVLARWHVFVAPVDGSPVRQIGNLTTDYIGVDDWSPDASWLLFGNAVRDEPPTGGIGIMDAQSGASTQLTTGGEEGSSFSPDGDRIVFNDSWGGVHLTVMNADGSADSRRVLVTAEAGTGIADPVWSPNGDWILYRVIPITDGSQTGIGDLWMVPSSGGEPRLVLKSAIADW